MGKKIRGRRLTASLRLGPGYPTILIEGDLVSLATVGVGKVVEPDLHSNLASHGYRSPILISKIGEDLLKFGTFRSTMLVNIHQNGNSYRQQREHSRHWYLRREPFPARRVGEAFGRCCRRRPDSDRSRSIGRTMDLCFAMHSRIQRQRAKQRCRARACQLLSVINVMTSTQGYRKCVSCGLTFSSWLRWSWKSSL